MLTASQQNELKVELSRFIAVSLYSVDEDILEEYGQDVGYLLKDIQDQAKKIFDKYFPAKPVENHPELVRLRATEKLSGYAAGEYRLTFEDIQCYMQDADLTEFKAKGLTLRLG